MTSKSEKDRAKQIQDRCQNILMQMLKDEDNKYCVDCDAKGPRWASWNLGIFLCIRCAGIHRNLGVHISKVKSVNLDSWTPEQVVSLQQMGNSRARAVYEANLPDSFRRPQNDSSLEAFIRAKYEHKKYIAKEWVPPPQPKVNCISDVYEANLPDSFRRPQNDSSLEAFIRAKYEHKKYIAKEWVPSPQPKVNWDKEIDEEMERQKRKKKSTSSGLGPLPAPTTSDKKYNKSDVIPSIPKPKSSVSPKLGRSTPTSQVQEPKPSNGAADLLGLETTKPDAKPSDDIFSSFFSAPEKPPEAKPEETKSDLKTEEENFFKQPAPSEKEKSKLTKDSILALYSQTPSTNLANQFQPQQSFGFGTYQAPPQPSYNMPAQNGMQPQFNQFQGTQFQGNNQFQQPFGTMQQPLQGQAFPQNQQFFSQPQTSQNLNQQFGSLNLGQNFPNAFPQNNIASNMWQ